LLGDSSDLPYKNGQIKDFSLTRAAAIKAEDVALMRGGRTLFEGLSWSAGPGQLIELRGPNGAGKTSLLRALAGFLKPSAGAIRFDNAEAPFDLHLLGHREGLKLNLSVAAHARFWAGLYGQDTRVCASALERVGLGSIADLPARVLSQGQGRRLSLARLLIAPRPIWLLDEPAAGLDAQGKRLLDELVAAHRVEGGVVIAALHEPLGATADAVVNL
jgi:heme exporter protein A